MRMCFWQIIPKKVVSLQINNFLIAKGNMDFRKLVKESRTRFIQISFVAVFLFVGMVFTPVNAQNTDVQEKDTTVKIIPEYPGGEEALNSFLIKNINYPVMAKIRGLQGIVITEFIVEKDGSISNVKVRESSGHRILDKEAVRVMKLMPNWSPGTVDGKPVRVKFSLPIEFKFT